MRKSNIPEVARKEIEKAYFGHVYSSYIDRQFLISYLTELVLNFMLVVFLNREMKLPMHELITSL